MEEKKKSNKGLICLVVILLLAVLGLGGYILVDKDIIKLKKEEKKTEEKVEPKEVELDPESEEVVSLMKKALGVDDYSVFSTCTSNLNVYRKGFDINSVENADLDILVTHYIASVSSKDQPYYEKKEIDLGTGSEAPAGSYGTLKNETYKNYVLEYFGPKYKFEIPKEGYEFNSHLSCGIYRYSKEYDCYLNISACGGICPDMYINKLDKAVKNSTEDSIVVDFYSFVLINDTENGGSYLRNDIESTDNIAYYNSDEHVYDTMQNQKDEIFAQYKDKAARYQFTFKKDGDNYYINKVEKIA